MTIGQIRLLMMKNIWMTKKTPKQRWKRFKSDMSSSTDKLYYEGNTNIRFVLLLLRKLTYLWLEATIHALIAIGLFTTKGYCNINIKIWFEKNHNNFQLACPIPACKPKSMESQLRQRLLLHSYSVCLTMIHHLT